MAKQKVGKDDLGSPDTRPCFYKIMWFANLIDLRIPPDFKEHLLTEETDRATLMTPGGNWDVKLLRDEGNIYFVEGWPEFVKHHSLGHTEFLLFKYNGYMSFDVVIYDKIGCARNYQSIGTSHQESGSSFTPSYPFFRHRMKDYNVGTKSSMLIPKAFQRTHLPLSRQIIILRNWEGVSWSASTTVTSTKHLSICGGWKAFSDDNSIKKGDVCIFELVEQNTMQVHIFR